MLFGFGGSICRPRGGTLQHRRQARDDALQRVALDREIVLQRDALGDDEVIACLCLVGVDDRRRADLEVALGLLQLLRDRAAPR
ncbi:MAG: hypothetical protein U1E63_13595 [Burkholderiales bacterium]